MRLWSALNDKINYINDKQFFMIVGFSPEKEIIVESKRKAKKNT